MKKIVINKNYLKEEDITEIVKRVKILFINSNNEILLGYSHNTYEFIGGHVEKNETLKHTVIRETKEESGIDLDFDKIKLHIFAENIGYYKDWPEKGKNRKIIIYYYEIKTDEKPNLNNTKYTENEKSGNFTLKYISLDNIEKVLNDNITKYGDDKGIQKEMLKLMEVYKLWKN